MPGQWKFSLTGKVGLWSDLVTSGHKIVLWNVKQPQWNTLKNKYWLWPKTSTANYIKDNYRNTKIPNYCRQPSEVFWRSPTIKFRWSFEDFRKFLNGHEIFEKLRYREISQGLQIASEKCGYRDSYLSLYIEAFLAYCCTTNTLKYIENIFRLLGIDSQFLKVPP